MNRVEFKWELTPSSELPDDGGSWKLENVSGKLIANRDDVLTYRLVYSSALGQRLGNSMLVVKVSYARGSCVVLLTEPLPSPRSGPSCRSMVDARGDPRLGSW